jgi:hypothetical protein
MASLIDNFQDRVKTSTNAIALLSFKTISGLFVGLTLALIGEEIMGYQSLSFFLVVAITTASLVRIAKSWTWTQVLIFNLIFVLIGLLLRMYILLAPY